MQTGEGFLKASCRSPSSLGGLVNKEAGVKQRQQPRVWGLIYFFLFVIFIVYHLHFYI